MSARFTPLVIALPAGATISPWVAVTFGAVWLLPDWVRKWLDVREQWTRRR